MKKLLSLFFSLILVNIAIGQSIQEVPANDNNGAPIINAIIQYVVADTNSLGAIWIMHKTSIGMKMVIGI